MDDLAHPRLRDLPIGIEAAAKCHETDSMGGVDVPAEDSDDPSPAATAAAQRKPGKRP